MNSKQFKGILHPGPTPPSPPPPQGKFTDKTWESPPKFVTLPPIGNISIVLPVFFNLKAPLMNTAM